MLQKAISEQVKQPQSTVKETDFDQVLQLRLEYRNIQTIEHLWDFLSLSRLELNNNDIKKIQGLDYLVNLTWLNLSFNKIRKIEGLEFLVKLQVLNLSNNRISVLENMDTLENLTHFMISNNLLRRLDNVLCLKQFKNLVTVTLGGNPFRQEEDYKHFVAAFVPNLTYLDFRPLDEDTRKEASARYFHELQKIESEEVEKQKKDRTQEDQEAELQLHKDAFVELLNGSHLFTSMFKGDPEAATLHSVPGVATLLHTFKQQMEELCMQLFSKGLSEHEQREAAVSSFFSGQNKAVEDYQQKASKTRRHFDRRYSEWIGEFVKLTDPNSLKVRIQQCNEEINQFHQNLLTLEFQLVSTLEANIKAFDTLISDTVGNFSETAQGIFVQCRDLENSYNQKVQAVAVEILEDVAADSLPEDMQTEDIMMLFSDKHQVMDALTHGHDNHLLKINDRETELVTRLSAWQGNLMKEIRDNELKRNRINIKDINRYTDYLKERLEKLSCETVPQKYGRVAGAAV
ncbi:dynein regulatory complex subunit 3 [Parambassis ranga]|uniref:Dynein regulatory complex subunit 3 n=1 Tax=Parambassis ranga TaxID=210632 RepID=A0A6P7IRZ6_9TELE|nr:dynein regulatory complex subunit 3 [Parambassis ranga]